VGAGNITPAHEDHRLDLVSQRIVRGDGDPPVGARLALVVSSYVLQHLGERLDRRTRAGIEPLRLGQVIERGVPAPERLLDSRDAAEEIRIRRRETHAPAVGVDGAGVVLSEIAG
jgi:hypothetical protein